MDQERGNYDWSDTRTLYLVLQGEFVLITKQSGDDHVDDKLVILAPDVHEHTYIAGRWLRDWKNAKPLPRCMEIRNVLGDCKRGKLHSPRSAPEQNIDTILHVPKSNGKTPEPRLQITAPMPFAIIPGLTEPKGTTKITVIGPDKQVSHPELPDPFALVVALVYKWRGSSKPFLYSPEHGEHLSKRLWSSGGPSKQMQSLHVFASTCGHQTERHPQDAFSAAAALLGTQAELTPSNPAVSNVYAVPPPGLAWAQVNLMLNCVLKFETKDARLKRDFIDPNNEADWPCGVVSVRGGSSNNCGPLTGH